MHQGPSDSKRVVKPDLEERAVVQEEQVLASLRKEVAVHMILLLTSCYILHTCPTSRHSGVPIQTIHENLAVSQISGVLSCLHANGFQLLGLQTTVRTLMQLTAVAFLEHMRGTDATQSIAAGLRGKFDNPNMVEFMTF